MTDWIVCEVCDCKYKQAVMPGGKLSGDITCPAIKIQKNTLDNVGEVWRERVLKHNPEWEEQKQQA